MPDYTIGGGNPGGVCRKLRLRSFFHQRVRLGVLRRPLGQTFRSKILRAFFRFGRVSTPVFELECVRVLSGLFRVSADLCVSECRHQISAYRQCTHCIRVLQVFLVVCMHIVDTGSDILHVLGTTADN